jgi:hypothetical protein
LFESLTISTVKLMKISIPKTRSSKALTKLRRHSKEGYALIVIQILQPQKNYNNNNINDK